MDKGFVCLYIVVLIHVGETNVIISSFFGNYSQHQNNCTTVRNFARGHITNGIVNSLKSNNITSAWLPLKRIQLGAWTWMDGSIYDEVLSTPGLEAEWHDCALFRAGDKMIDDVRCSKLLSHFICDTKSRTCTEIIDRYKCVEVNSTSYVIFAHKGVSWYTARQKCAENEMNLASFPKKDGPEIMEQVSTSLGRYDNVWIGLRLVDYKREGESGDQEAFNWAAGQPCDCPGLDCVVVNQQGTWEAANCSASHPHICYIAPNKMKDKEKHKPSSNVILAAALSAVAVILFCLGVLLCYCRKKRQQNAGEEKQSNGSKNLKEGDKSLSSLLRDSTADSGMKHQQNPGEGKQSNESTNPKEGEESAPLLVGPPAASSIKHQRNPGEGKQSNEDPSSPVGAMVQFFEEKIKEETPGSKGNTKTNLAQTRYEKGKILDSRSKESDEDDTNTFSTNRVKSKDQESLSEDEANMDKGSGFKEESSTSGMHVSKQKAECDKDDTKKNEKIEKDLLDTEGKFNTEPSAGEPESPYGTTGEEEEEKLDRGMTEGDRNQDTPSASNGYFKQDGENLNTSIDPISRAEDGNVKTLMTDATFECEKEETLEEKKEVEERKKEPTEQTEISTGSSYEKISEHEDENARLKEEDKTELNHTASNT